VLAVTTDQHETGAPTAAKAGANAPNSRGARSCAVLEETALSSQAFTRDSLRMQISQQMGKYDEAIKRRTLAETLQLRCSIQAELKKCFFSL